MANITTLSTQLMDIKRKETLEAQAIRKTVGFNEIHLVNSKSIEYNGQRLGITDNAIKDIIKLMGMPETFVNKFGKLFSEEAKMQFINRIKDAMATNIGKLSTVTLVVNPIERKIVAVKKADDNSISNDKFLSVVDRIIDQNNMDVTNWSINSETGLVSINAFNPAAQFGIKGMENEHFTGGVNFTNSPNGGFQVMPYVNRLFCTNGIVASLSEETYELQSLDNTTMEKFFENLNNLRRNHFVPNGFVDLVKQANTTPASLYELSRAHSRIKDVIGERAENWIPLKENMDNYAKAGIELNNVGQLNRAKSNQSIWSTVNALTHFGTHGQQYVDTFNPSVGTQLQVTAGHLLGGKWSFGNEVPDIYGNNILSEAYQIGANLN
jgi:hypothetical protein